MATKDDIKLPPLHYDELPEVDDVIPAMHNYARKAIKADRQRREYDLFEALDELANGYAGNGWDVGLVTRLEKARAAIAKAKGEKHDN